MRLAARVLAGAVGGRGVVANLLLLPLRVAPARTGRRRSDRPSNAAAAASLSTAVGGAPRPSSSSSNLRRPPRRRGPTVSALGVCRTCCRQIPSQEHLCCNPKPPLFGWPGRNLSAGSSSPIGWVPTKRRRWWPSCRTTAMVLLPGPRGSPEQAGGPLTLCGGVCGWSARFSLSLSISL